MIFHISNNTNKTARDFYKKWFSLQRMKERRLHELFRGSFQLIQFLVNKQYQDVYGKREKYHT